MSILEKQLKKLLSEAQIEIMKKGKYISIDRLANFLKEKIELLDGGPTVRPISLERRKQLNLDVVNNQFKNAEFDMDVAYSVIRDYFSDTLKSYSKADLSYKSQRAQLKGLNSVLNELLFVTNNTEDYFYGVFDDFSDVSKVDLNRTSELSINLNEGVLELPYNWSGSKKVDLSHLFRIQEGDVSSTALSGTKLLTQKGLGSKYGDLFNDIESIWRYHVITNSKEGAECTITFPVTSGDSIEVISKVEVTGYAGSGVKLRLLTSLDKENFTRPEETNDIFIKEDTEKVSWDFPSRSVRWIRIILTKSYPDSSYSETSSSLSSPFTNTQVASYSNQEKWMYSFTIKNISLYKIGRSQDTVFYSKPLKPSTSPNLSIDKVALFADETIPSHTAIDYEIAACDSAGNLLSSYFSIAPSERTVTNLPKVISFSESSIFYTGKVVTGISSGDLILNKMNYFYPVLDVDSGNYIYGNNELFVGDGLWKVTSEPSVRTVNIKGNYLNFSDGSRVKSLYHFTEETAVAGFYVGDSSNYITSLKVSGPIVNSLKPSREDGVDPEPGLDPEPDYAVEYVKHIKSVSSITGYSIAPSGALALSNGVSVPVANVWTNVANNTTGSVTGNVRYPSIGVPITYEGQLIEIDPNSVVLKYNSGDFSYTFRKNIDYSIKRSDDVFFEYFSSWDPFPLHWRIVGNETVVSNITTGSQLFNQLGRQTGQIALNYSNFPPAVINGNFIPSNASLNIDFEIDPDITHRVSRVSYSTNEVLLDSAINIAPGDSVVVSYKKKPSNINRSTVIVKQKQSSADPGTVYSEGVDYTVDIVNGIISLLNNGRINSSTSKTVYIDYDFREEVEPTKIYSVWCYYGSNQPSKLQYSDPNIRSFNNEGFWWTYESNGDFFTKKIDDFSEILLSKGWHKFTVRSLDPSIFNDSAIIRILKLRDINGNLIFKRPSEGNIYFSQITGSRNSLVQVDHTFMINSVLKKDFNKFSIFGNKIYLNHNPLTSGQYFMKKVNNLGLIEDVNSFFVEFYGKVNSNLEDKKTHLILKITLSRTPDSSGGVTPKLSSYNIRISY